MNRRFPPQTEYDAPLPVKRTRKRSSRSFMYRDVHFMTIPSDGLTRVYVLSKPNREPVYQCTVHNDHVRYAVFALARIALAEKGLQAIVAKTVSKARPETEQSL